MKIFIYKIITISMFATSFVIIDHNLWLGIAFALIGGALWEYSFHLVYKKAKRDYVATVYQAMKSVNLGNVYLYLHRESLRRLKSKRHGC